MYEWIDTMPRLKISLLVTLALLAFTANSLLCRLALQNSHMDPALFTAVRLGSGALVLVLLTVLSNRTLKGQGSWMGALALLGYATGFSFAYVELETGMGALLLFGAVQFTMLAYGLLIGERLTLWQWIGFILAAMGLFALFSPGLGVPTWQGALFMTGAGICWALYSLLGLKPGAALASTAANFVRTIPLAALLLLTCKGDDWQSTQGLGYAIASGALASGIGYALWYFVMPKLSVITASTVQLSVPVLAAIAGFIWLLEPFTLRFVFCALAILGGVALVLVNKKRMTRAGDGL